ncbi:MAG: hypothetical protein BWY82_02968 [Verrucomicrobia bacterium ADurb.Bin474]|nr:MAG: hypothetical protein BWY82_02968 [Verrucomicrobia bacterium ADurb.Bin474]
MHIRIFQDSLLHHPAAASAAFFSRLKNELHGAFKTILQTTQHFHRPRQNRGMAIVTTCMHQPGLFRGISTAGLFLDRKRIHVGPQCHTPPWLTPPEHRDHTRSGNARPDVNTRHILQKPDHLSRGLLFLIAELRLFVNAMTQAHYFGLNLPDQLFQLLGTLVHNVSPDEDTCRQSATPNHTSLLRRKKRPQIHNRPERCRRVIPDSNAVIVG